ncbi:Cytochrome P450 [Musa troglodytarum]|uniref:Cytochrome P450 n=1 Tax=Musa troglodytarum TaxID=320322 RepID=A0A9E7H0B7_9LILI|nr:Cytochrome P450 [Musa troglodytarum]
MEATTTVSSSFHVIVLIPISILFIYHLLRRCYSTAKPTGNYCPFADPLLGNLIPYLRNQRRFLDWAADLLSRSPTGTIELRGPLGIFRGVATVRPLVVDHLLRSNFSNYVKGDRTRAALSDLLGHGIFSADGHLWSLQRKTASREFTTRSLKSFVSDVVRFQLRDRLLPRLSVASDEGGTVDLQDLLRRFAFDNICTIAFGTDPASLRPGSGVGAEDHSFFDAFDAAVEISSARMFAPLQLVWKLKRFLNVGSERKLRNVMKTIDEYAMNIIELKEQQGTKKLDLLSRFAAALEEDDNQQKRKFLRDIVISFILAGKDTTSAGLTWFFWLLAVHPRSEQRIYEEITKHDEEAAQVMGYEELKGMKYLHAAITEALRVYPPVPIDSRVAVADDVLPDGTCVKAGWFADYCPYAMARDEGLWGTDCRDFKPERWLDEKGEFVGMDAARFPVFNAGPRTCMGKEMAYVQMKAVAAAVIRRFRVEVAALEHSGEHEMSITLRMKGGLPVRLKRRMK